MLTTASPGGGLLGVPEMTKDPQVLRIYSRRLKDFSRLTPLAKLAVAEEHPL